MTAPCLITDEDLLQLSEIVNLGEINIVTIDSEIHAELARQHRVLNQQYRGLDSLHRNYRTGIRALLEKQHSVISKHNQISLLQKSFFPQHPGYPLSDWRKEVANNRTTLGYWEWLHEEIGLEMT